VDIVLLLVTNCGEAIVFGLGLLAVVFTLATILHRREQRQQEEYRQAERRRREREKLPKPGYCRGCGTYLREFGKCTSELRLEVSALEFDISTGKRWYENAPGLYDWKAFCVDHRHTHAVIWDYNKFCSCIQHLSPKRGGYDFVVHLLGPELVNDKFAKLRGACGKDYCPSCGLADPTRPAG
jgi:hypothetical protein